MAQPVLPIPPPVALPSAAPRLRPLEVAYGLAFGAEGTPPPPGAAESVAEAFDRSLRTALARPPCLVSFSGGRDSSALLAWAVDLARREGWDLPVPATLVIPGDSDADEADWQRQVLEHVGITERIMFEVRDELDCLGPVATDMLSRHGLVWPFNTHMHIPIFAAAAGGSVVTGFGGDELGRSSQLAVRAAQVVTRRRPPRRSDALVLGLAAAPPAVRLAVMRRRTRGDLADLSWLTPLAVDRLASTLGGEDAAEPRRWDSILTRWWPTQRYFRVTERCFEVSAATWDTAVVHPFADHDVHVALAARGGAGGLGTRAQVMETIFGGLVPQTILHRESKAAFSNVLYTATARDFARQWSGGGVDSELVDTDRLRAHWLDESGPADMRSMALLQSAWLHDHGR